MKKIVIIEDDPAIVMGLEESLSKEYDLKVFTNGSEGIEHLIINQPDLLILDIMLPGKNGLDILRSLREKNYDFPVLMLTSKKEEIDKVIGFEFGADDYVTKPFGIMELQARIKAILKRSQKKTDVTYQFGNIKVIFTRMEVYKNNKEINLSAKEMSLFKYLITHEGRIITRDEFLDNVWGYDSFPTTRTVDNYILSLRKKIEDEPSNPKYIITVPTLGYKFIGKHL